MASLVGGLFGQLKPSSKRGLFGNAKGKPVQATLRGASKRAYVFEVYRREVVADLGEIGAVYIYARTTTPDPATPDSPQTSEAGFEPGYVGRTSNLARRDAEHDQHGHFIGFAFDVVLVLRIEQEPIRAGIESDLIEQYRPVLNELLRGYQGNTSS